MGVEQWAKTERRMTQKITTREKISKKNDGTTTYDRKGSKRR